MRPLPAEAGTASDKGLASARLCDQRLDLGRDLLAHALGIALGAAVRECAGGDADRRRLDDPPGRSADPAGHGHAGLAARLRVRGEAGDQLRRAAALDVVHLDLRAHVAVPGAEADEIAPRAIALVD